MGNFNHYLLDSIKTNRLNIRISDYEYNVIQSNIVKFRTIYQNEIQHLYDKKRSIYGMYKHTQLVKEIISDVIALFPQMKDYGACCFLTGSFSRCSCKRNSDLDFHVVYLKEYHDESIKYEEIIYYMLSEIFMLGRDKIHPMLLTKMYPSLLSFLDDHLDCSDFTINIISENYTIHYMVSARLKRRLYLQYCKDNSLDRVFRYIKDEIDRNNREWAHVITPITMVDEFCCYYENLYQYEKKNITVHKILFRIQNLKSEIHSMNQLLIHRKQMKISDFKTIYQKKEFNLINNYISLKRDICLFHHGEWRFIHYYDNLNYLRDDIAFQQSLKYMFLLFDMIEPFGNKYSLHRDELLEIGDIELLVKQIKILNKEISISVFREEMLLDGENCHDYAYCTVS